LIKTSPTASTLLAGSITLPPVTSNEFISRSGT
jgi:hypothetical protein